jgi:DNA-binding NtrC family response regulator
MQVDLLRVLQEGRFTPLGASEAVDTDFRLVASSKVPLQDLVDNGRLRQDLFYRLQVVEVEIPPLRKRSEDILPLARRAIDREATQLNLTRRPLSKQAAEMLMNHNWPGNVRELEQAVRRAIIIGDGSGPISVRELGIEVTPKKNVMPSVGPSKKDTMPEGERERILDALERCQWNRTRAANELGIPRRTFYRKIEKLGIVTKK